VNLGFGWSLVGLFSWFVPFLCGLPFIVHLVYVRSFVGLGSFRLLLRVIDWFVCGCFVRCVPALLAFWFRWFVWFFGLRSFFAVRCSFTVRTFGRTLPLVVRLALFTFHAVSSRTFAVVGSLFTFTALDGSVGSSVAFPRLVSFRVRYWFRSFVSRLVCGLLWVSRLHYFTHVLGSPLVGRCPVGLLVLRSVCWLRVFVS